jgi:hypothetical protein
MSGIIIRKATKDDINVVHELAHAIWPTTYKEILFPF